MMSVPARSRKVALWPAITISEGIRIAKVDDHGNHAAALIHTQSSSDFTRGIRVKENGEDNAYSARRKAPGFLVQYFVAGSIGFVIEHRAAGAVEHKAWLPPYRCC